eukprot:359252-Chlamydomonas_euryale.AAC.10
MGTSTSANRCPPLAGLTPLQLPAGRPAQGSRQGGGARCWVSRPSIQDVMVRFTPNDMVHTGWHRVGHTG